MLIGSLSYEQLIGPLCPHAGRTERAQWGHGPPQPVPWKRSFFWMGGNTERLLLWRRRLRGLLAVAELLLLPVLLERETMSLEEQQDVSHEEE